MLRGAVLIAVLAGAAASLGLMLYAGRRNSSLLLAALFAIWVLSPYTALMVANRASKGWSVLARTALYIVMLAVTAGSVAIYGAEASGRLKVKLGFVFLMVPLASWLVIAIVVAIGRLVSRGLSRASRRA